MQEKQFDRIQVYDHRVTDAIVDRLRTTRSVVIVLSALLIICLLIGSLPYATVGLVVFGACTCLIICIDSLIGAIIDALCQILIAQGELIERTRGKPNVTSSGPV